MATRTRARPQKWQTTNDKEPATANALLRLSTFTASEHGWRAESGQREGRQHIERGQRHEANRETNPGEGQRDANSLACLRPIGLFLIRQAAVRENSEGDKGDAKDHFESDAESSDIVLADCERTDDVHQRGNEGKRLTQQRATRAAE